ncbi:uncharacterized protein LOC100176010 [Ciona intestinalis]
MSNETTVSEAGSGNEPTPSMFTGAKWTSELTTVNDATINVTASNHTLLVTHQIIVDYYNLTPTVIVCTLLFVLLVLVSVFVVYVVRAKRRRRKRRKNPFHMPIIEYKEDNISISTFSSAGYGTYDDLEECYKSEDVPSKIDGRLTLGRCGSRKESSVQIYT